MYDTVIWDIDGTLLDTAEGLVSAYQYSIKALNLASKEVGEIKSFIGPVPKMVFMKHFNMDEPEAQKASDVFRMRYKKHDLLKARLYEGIPYVLELLQGKQIKQAVATNKRQDYALDICKYFRLDRFLNPILGPDNISSKSKADLIAQCMRELGSVKAVMIGDTISDSEAARTAGIDFIGVNYGFGFHNVEGYANTPTDILKLLGLE